MEIAYACKRWRTNPENSFFPTPGKLLGLMANKFEQPDRKYDNDRFPAIPASQMERRDGYYRASPEEEWAAARLRREMAD